MFHAGSKLMGIAAGLSLGTHQCCCL